MTPVELTLWIAAIAVYTVILFWGLLWFLRACSRVYRWFRPAPPPAKDFDLQAGEGYRFTPEPGQTVLGANAKAFFIQAAIGIIVFYGAKILLWDWLSPTAIGGYFRAIGW